MRRAVKMQARQRFIEAGLWRLTGQEVPGLGKCLPHPDSEVYAALASAADRLTTRELTILAEAFDDEN